MLLVDNQEAKVFKYLDKEKIEYRAEALPIGDFVLEEKGIVIERKTLSDFAGSIRSGHLQKQLLQMEQAPFPFLIISGKMSEVHYLGIHWTVEHHLGALSSCAVRYKTKILQVDNDLQLIRLVKKICNKVGDGRTITIEDTELLRNTVDVADMRLKLLTCFRGVGIKKAKKILESDEDIKDILDGLIEEMEENGHYKS